MTACIFCAATGVVILGLLAYFVGYKRFYREYRSTSFRKDPSLDMAGIGQAPAGPRYPQDLEMQYNDHHAANGQHGVPMVHATPYQATNGVPVSNGVRSAPH